MITFDQIIKARRLGSINPQQARELLDSIKCDSDAERDAWVRADRWLKECAGLMPYTKPKEKT